MKNQELTYLIEKLYTIDKDLGGKAKQQNAAKTGNEFDNIKEIILEKLFALNKRIAEKEEKMQKFGNDRDNIALGVKIRDDVHEVERLLSNMNEAIRKQLKNPKKYPRIEVEQRERQYQNFCDQLENLKVRESGGVVSDDLIPLKGQTYTEQKNFLMGGYTSNPNRVVKYEVTKDEEEAMRRWDGQNKEMDNKLDVVIDGVGLMKDKAIIIGDKIGQTQKQTYGLIKEVDKTNETLTSSNRKLKELILKYRRPNKFCLDITLFLLFIGLIGVAINMYQKKSG